MSTSASQPKPSAAGSADVTGIAILANPRIIPGSKTIVFDAQLYLEPTDQDLLIGSLRYFNSANLTFDEVFYYRDSEYIIAYFLNPKLSFSLLDENPRPMCQFRAAEHFWITPSSVTYRW